MGDVLIHENSRCEEATPRKKTLRRLDISPRANPKSTIIGDKFRITVLTDGLLRVEYAEDDVFEDRASTFAIHRDLPVPDFKVLETKDLLEIKTHRFHLTYDKKEFSPAGLSVSIPLSSIHENGWRIPWRFGKKNAPNLFGTARTLDEANGRIPLEPGVIGREGVCMLDDSESMILTEDWIDTRGHGSGSGARRDFYLFCFGHDYRAAMDSFYAISGAQPIVPRWSLGNWWSRYAKYTTDEYIGLMDKFRAEGIPLSVGVLDMNWHREDDVPKKYGTGWTGYSWDRTLIPEPAKLTKALHKRSLKVTANDHPADGIRAFEDQYEEIAKAMGIDPASEDPVHFDITDKRFVDTFFDVLHRKLEDEDGIDFWWLDWQQGPYSKIAGIDPLWVLNHFDFLTNGRKGRPLTFSRYAGPGSHRYPVGFSGDSVVTWESLAFQPEFTATASNIGYGFWSNDIGGHMQGYKSDELATRWVQLGVFSPINRLHSTLSEFNRKEPWLFGRDARAAMTAALQLRHRLVPYIYTMNYRSAVHNESLVSPLYWDHPADGRSYNNKNQFLFGNQLMVIPITSPASTVSKLGSVRAFLPHGTYVDIFTGAIYTGDRELWLHRTYDTIPVLAQTGAIIPLDAALVPENGCPLPTALELIVIVGRDGSFVLVEDDGTGRTTADIKFSKTQITWTQDSTRLHIGPVEGEPLVAARAWTIRFKSVVEAHGNTPVMHCGKYACTVEGQDLLVHVPSTPATEAITIDVPPEVAGRLARFDYPATLRTLLYDASMAFEMKAHLDGILHETEASTLAKAGKIIGLDFPEEVKAVIMEYLLADAR